MATFTCTACDFSKPVADEMAGKKARCPKCNAVMTIPPLEGESTDSADSEQEVESEPVQQETAEESTTEQASSTNKPEPVETSSSSSRSRKQEEALPESVPVPQSWLMGLGGAILLVVVAVILFVLQQINLGIICFATGILAFAAMSVMFCFGSKT